jgi:uncharacterized membrane protein (UPF0136 family)
MPADAGHCLVVNKSISSVFAGVAAAFATVAPAAADVLNPETPIAPPAAPPIAPPLAMIALWIYVTLLLAGGLVGLIKAGSKISLVTSALFAALLALCATGVIRPFWIADILVGLVAVVFIVRYLKSSKFMPSGLMLLFSAVVLAVLLAERR